MFIIDSFNLSCDPRSVPTAEVPDLDFVILRLCVGTDHNLAFLIKFFSYCSLLLMLKIGARTSGERAELRTQR
jgi:hypothetical protein